MNCHIGHSIRIDGDNVSIDGIKVENGSNACRDGVVVQDDNGITIQGGVGLFDIFSSCKRARKETLDPNFKMENVQLKGHPVSLSFPANGGRRFIVERENLSYNELLQKFASTLSDEPTEVERETWKNLKALDLYADKELQKKGRFFRLLTFVRSFFGNLGFDRKKFVRKLDCKLSPTERKVANFSQVILATSANLFIKQGEGESLRIQAEPHVVGMISTEVNKSVLTIRNVGGYSTRKPVEIFLCVKELTSLRVDGAGDIKSQGQIRVDNLNLEVSGAGGVKMDVIGNGVQSKISGAGKIKLKGEVNAQKIEIYGAGKYEASGLESKLLDAHISGAGNVLYGGSPQVTQKITGAGSITNH